MNSKDNYIESLNAISVDLLPIPFDWEINVDKWCSVLPDPSQLSVSDCMLLLNMRDEIELLRSRVSEHDNVELWRHAVLESDRRHIEDFKPFINMYYDIPVTYDSPSSHVMQARLRNLPVNIITINGEPKITMSHELDTLPFMTCWAFTILGYLPPFSAIEEVDFSGPIDHFILASCMRTVEVTQHRCTLKLALIMKVLEKSKERKSIN